MNYSLQDYNVLVDKFIDIDTHIVVGNALRK